MYDVIRKYERVPAEIVARYAKLEESASINECMPEKNGALDSRIKPMWRDMRVCGTAVTVRCGTGDNLMLHRAIDMAGPGDVLMVINNGYDEAGGLFGGMMAASLKARGAAGIVIDGASRDSVQVGAVGLPVFSRNIGVKATTKLVPGKINHPIVIGGVYVEPGDLVFGDCDSVVVVPKRMALQVLERAEAREAGELTLAERIQRGETTTFELFRANYEKLGLSEEPLD